MTHIIRAKNCAIEIIDRIGNDDVYLNISYHRVLPEGESLQIVLPRKIANAIANILLQDA